MMQYRFFLWLLVASCHGVSSVYRSDRAEDQRNQASGTYHLRQDEYDFNEKALERFEDWYHSLIEQHGPCVDPTIIVLDIYDYAAQCDQLPFLGPTGTWAAYKASKVCKRGKKIFSHDRKGMEFIRCSCKPIPQEYQQACLSMALRLVDRLFREHPAYKKLSKRFTDLHQTFTDLCTKHPERVTDLEQPLIQEGQQTYSHAMAYLEKLFMEHSDGINKSTNLLFYSDTYPNCLYFLMRNHLHLCPFPVLYLLAILSGSAVLVNAFLGFCEQQGMNVKQADALAKTMCPVDRGCSKIRKYPKSVIGK